MFACQYSSPTISPLEPHPTPSSQSFFVASKAMRLVAMMVSTCLLAACAPRASQPTAKASPLPSPIAVSPSPEPSPVASQSHVFVIVMENRSYNQVIGSGYISELAARYGVATDYHGVTHPSL